MSEQKQPKVRFSGFDDDWEQCTLKDVSARITRKNSNLESNLPLTISAQDGLVDQNTFFGKTIASKDTTGYFLLKKGEFAYNKSYSKGYPFGAVKRLDKYDEGVLSTLYIVFAPRHISSTFLAVYYDSKSWYKEIYRNAAEGARNHGLLNISSSDFFDSKLTIPSDKNEQRFIGRFIKTIDKLIAANQRQLEELKTIKKLAMQKIFDQEWRFNGFTDAWEQRKFESFSGKNSGGGTPSTKIESYWNGKTPWIQSSDLEKDQLFGVVPQKYISKEAINNSATKIIPANSIAVVTRVAVGKVAFMSFDYATSQDFLSLVGLHVNALFGVYDIFRFMKGESKSTQGTSIKGITKNEFLNSKTFVPETEKEQLRIGELLANIDNLIAANQSKSEQLKKLKKWFMQNMFM